MKEGSKKEQRVLSKGAESLGAKRSEKGQGKEKENTKKQKRDDDKEEIESEAGWRSFMTA